MLQKYFIAIIPSNEVLQKIQHLKIEICNAYNTNGALKSPAHITLHMPFLWEDTKEEKLISCLSIFKNKNAFEITLQNFNCFEPRVVFIDVVKNERLFDLQKKLVSHVKQHLLLFNQSDDKRGFHPHITIAFRDLKKPFFYKLWDVYKDQTFNEYFTCQSFSLLKNTGQNWEVYHTFRF